MRRDGFFIRGRLLRPLPTAKAPLSALANRRSQWDTPSTVKVDFNVFMVDVSTSEYYLAYDVGMFAGLAGAKSSGIAKLRFE